jgi:uncharacterized coiled-coil protein SlyX/transposase-like protein
MVEEGTIKALEHQLRLSLERERESHILVSRLSEQIRELSAQNVQFSDRLDSLAVQIQEQFKTIESLREALLQKSRDVSSLSGRNRGLVKLLNNTSERVTPEVSQSEEPQNQPISPKERGNNGAKRKNHICHEEQVIDIWPDDPEFDREKATELRVVESIRYEYFPSRVIKKIIRQHNCVVEGKVYHVCPPRTPLMNSHYEASFIAGLLQLRYTYSMPVERIVKYINEGGFELEKSTAHSLIGKSAELLSCFEEVMRTAVHTDPCIRMDETYHRVVNEGKNEKGKATRKGYLWSAMADTLQLVHFFYKNGSRGKEVFEGYLDKSYRGAVHTDGLVCYKEIETDHYPDAIRISCIQHAKRKFLEIEKDAQAIEIVDLINLLYRIEDSMPAEWSAEERVAHRNEKAPPVLRELKEKLLLIKSDPATLPSSPLSVATHYLLNEFSAIENYLRDAAYTLDNNAIERANRYISLSRRNSLFFGSHEGAERSALLYSLACSCRLHDINTYEYFTDLLTRMAYLPPNAPYEVLRELLPDRWKKPEREVDIQSSA